MQKPFNPKVNIGTFIGAIGSAIASAIATTFYFGADHEGHEPIVICVVALFSGGLLGHIIVAWITNAPWIDLD